MIAVRDLLIELPGFRLGRISLEIEDGEFFALMGPTGSGKTLLLESIAGLMRPTSGRIIADGEDITDLQPEQRSIGLVYQDHALFPHMSVLKNITYGRRYHGMTREQGRKLAGELMDVLGLSHLADRKPVNLSGGEKQRTALARALVCRPSVLLLDEPLSSLDPQFREDVRRTLSQLHAASSTTFLMVTHDFVDALTLAGRAAVIRKGELEQVGDVRDIFRKPATEFTARFTGMKNVFPAEFSAGECGFAGVHIPLPEGFFGTGDGYAALRPEDVYVSGDGLIPEGRVILRGTVRRVFREGFSWAVEAECGGILLTARLGRRQALEDSVRPGMDVGLHCEPEAVHCIAKES